jgi:hypothetical protein
MTSLTYSPPSSSLDPSPASDTKLSASELSAIFDSAVGLSTNTNININKYQLALYRTDGSELSMTSKILVTILKQSQLTHIPQMYLTMVDRNIALILEDSQQVFRELAPIVKAVFLRAEPVKSLCVIIDGKIWLHIINRAAKGSVHFCVVLKTPPVPLQINENQLVEEANNTYNIAKLESSVRRYRYLVFFMLLYIFLAH